MPRRNCQSRRIMHDMNPNAACPEGRPLIVRTMRPSGDPRSGPRERLPRDRMTPTIRVMYPADSDLTPKPMKTADTIMLIAAGQPNDNWPPPWPVRAIALNQVSGTNDQSMPVARGAIAAAKARSGRLATLNASGSIDATTCTHSAALLTRDAGRIRNSRPNTAHATRARKSPAAQAAAKCVNG